ncbi:apolipoprotein N-acyltransferase [bacterium]|nr:apolipoprotein N-acyltransferase [bacterium]
MFKTVKLGKFFFTILSGCLLILIFPNFNYSSFAWISLIPLLIAVEKENFSSVFYLGFLSGVIAYTGILYWLGETMIKYGQMPAILSYLILLALVFYLAVYVGVFCLLYKFFVLHVSSRLLHILFGGFLWVFLELCRSCFFSGFPWALLGYSQWKNTFLIQIAGITGSYGVSFLIVIFNIALLKILDTQWRGEKLRKKIQIIIIVGMGLSVCYSYGYVVIRQAEKEDKSSVKVVVLQGNIPQKMKWDSAYKPQIMRVYTELVKKTKSLNPQLIVWPEAAIPGYVNYEHDLSRWLEELIKQSGCNHIIGGPDIKYSKKSFEKERYYNSAFLFSSEGKILNQHDKIHLVPFGEMVPLRWLFSKVINVLNEIGDFDKGKEIRILKLPEIDAGVFICFEIIFPNLIRRFVNKGAKIIINITNDAWFGKTSAPYQHFSTCVFRAVENRIYVVRAANTGISGFIDPFGRIKKTFPLFVKGYLHYDVFLSTKKTFYTKYGNVFAYGCSIMVVILMAMAKREAQKKKGTKYFFKNLVKKY